jgi:DNA polymerase III epsilon subunit-like protein
MTNLDELIQARDEARNDFESAENALKSAKKAFEDETSDMSKRVKELKSIFETHDHALRTALVAQRHEDSNFKHDGVSYRTSYTPKYGEQEMLEYLIANGLHQYLTIDTKTLNSALVKHQIAIPKFVDFDESTTVAIENAELSAKRLLAKQREQVYDICYNLMLRNAITMSIETTGFYGHVCAVSLMDSGSEIIYRALIKPPVPIEAGASAHHGIADDMVQDSPSLADAWGEILALIGQKPVCVYNAEWVIDVLKREGLGIKDLEFVCVMELYAKYNNSKSVKLDVACNNPKIVGKIDKVFHVWSRMAIPF